MKKIILLIILAFSMFAHSQEKKDDQVRAFSAMRLQVFYPIQFGDHSLAKAHDGVLATFDRKISTDAVIGGRSALHIIGN